MTKVTVYRNCPLSKYIRIAYCAITCQLIDRLPLIITAPLHPLTPNMYRLTKTYRLFSKQFSWRFPHASCFAVIRGNCSYFRLFRMSK